ncbi:MAG: DUF255 domain-containing protein [Promethearchaeota archaeon]
MNHLKGESSPYLKQHQNNPVNWYPYGSLEISLQTMINSYQI